MKKKITLIFIFLTVYSYSQCTFNDLIPFKLNLTSYEFDSFISSQKSITIDSEKTEMSALLSDQWKKYEYLPTDSFLIEHRFYNMQSINCFDNKTAFVYTRFIDHKLFYSTFEIEFMSSEYEQFIRYYEKFEKIFKDHYIYNTPTELYNGDKKTGEGYTFYQSPNDYISDSFIINPNFKTLSYNKEYKYKRIRNNSEGVYYWIETGIIEKYIITITIVDLSETKLDSRGW